MSTASPQPDPAPPSLAVTILLTAAHIVAWLALLAFLYFSVPAYEKLFLDFRMRLPDYTVAVIRVSRWLNEYLLLLVPALFLLAAADGAVLFLLRRRPGTRPFARLWFALLLLLPALALTGCWLAMRHPYAQLLERLGGKK
jgi:type II secretory pathway component PulF